jgi:hypothetical protein
MNPKSKTMKKFIIIITAVIFALSVNPLAAQQTNELSGKDQQKLTKQQRKEAKKEQELKEYELFNKLAEDSSFVFTGNQWIDRSRGMVSVDPAVNFLIVKGKKAFFQFGLDGAGPGANGLGGASLEARVVGYKYQKGKNSKKSSSVIITIKPQYYSGTITFNLMFFGSEGTLDFSGGRGQRITMNGKLYPHEKVNLMGSGSMFLK